MTYPTRSADYGRGRIPRNPLEYVAQRCADRDAQLDHRIERLESKVDLWITRGIAATLLLMVALLKIDPSSLDAALKAVVGH